MHSKLRTKNWMWGERAYWCCRGKFYADLPRLGKVRPFFFPRRKFYTYFFRGQTYPGAVFPGGRSMRGETYATTYAKTGETKEEWDFDTLPHGSIVHVHPRLLVKVAEKSVTIPGRNDLPYHFGLAPKMFYIWWLKFRILSKFSWIRYRTLINRCFPKFAN